MRSGAEVGGACQKRFSWFSDWSPKVHKCVNLVDLVKSFLNLLFERDSYSNVDFLAKFGFDTAENEPCQACPIPRNAAASVPWSSDPVEDRRVRGGFSNVLVVAHGRRVVGHNACGDDGDRTKKKLRDNPLFES